MLVSHGKIAIAIGAFVLTSGFDCAFAQAANAVPDSARSQSLRQLQQLQQSVDRYRTDQQAQSLREKSQTQIEQPSLRQEIRPGGDLSFTLKRLTHTGSTVLSEKEIETIFTHWLGKTISVGEIAKILDEINALYRQKGYLVCQAAVKPQRISQGHLEITLIEGQTDKVSVLGLKSTNESFVRQAFDLEPGKVANYREMVDDLIAFNMTNDVALTIDISAGDVQYASDYTIRATEPDRWGGSVFADTTGSDSTGRPRIGATILNRSVFGRRDALMLLGLASQGSKSAMASYAVPLNSFGTRITGTLSYGDVEIVDGPSEDFDVTGESLLMSLRLEHPFYVRQNQKWTAWVDVGRQKSTTDMFSDVRISDTEIKTYSAGVDAVAFGSNWLTVATVDVSHHEAREELFSNTYRYEIGHVNFSGRYTFSGGIELSGTLSSQWRLAGDDFVSADYFYLGHTSGVRGYDNDLLSAQEGAILSVELTYPLFGPKASVFAFSDVGHLWGESPYSENTLLSAGLGIHWPLFDGASMKASAAFPLKRNLDDDIEVNKVRFDLSFVGTW